MQVTRSQELVVWQKAINAVTQVYGSLRHSRTRKDVAKLLRQYGGQQRSAEPVQIS